MKYLALGLAFTLAACTASVDSESESSNSSGISAESVTELDY